MDGLHRWKAHILADFEDIEIEYHVVPEGMPVKLYAASLSAQNGDRITKTDPEAVARDTVRGNPHYSQKEIAKRLSVTPKTVSKWVSDITEHHRDVLKVRALILSRLGHTQERIAEQIGRERRTIGDWLAENGNGNFPPLSEELLQEAIAAWPDENGEVAGTPTDHRTRSLQHEARKCYAHSGCTPLLPTSGAATHSRNSPQRKVAA